MIYRKIKNIYNKIIKLKYKLILEENYMNSGNQNLLDSSLQCVEDFKFNFKYEPKIILDIGACIGLFSLNMSKILPKSNIYSFEPVKESFELIKKNSFGTFNVSLGKKIYINQLLRYRGIISYTCEQQMLMVQNMRLHLRSQNTLIIPKQLAD